METQWSWSPLSLTVRGQGCLILWLTFTTWLWTLGRCQLSLDSTQAILPSKTTWTAFSTSPAQFLQTSFLPEVTSSYQPLGKDLVSASVSSVRENLSSTSALSKRENLSRTPEFSVRDAQQFTGSFFITDSYGDLLPSHTLSESETLQSSVFVPSSVSLYSTPASVFDEGSFEFGGVNGLRTNTAEGWDHAMPSVSDESILPLTIKSTVFVDSVAPSVRRDPTEGLLESITWVSHVRQSTKPDLDTDPFALHESSSSAFVFLAPTTRVEELTPSFSVESTLQIVTTAEIQAAPSASLPSKVFSITEMNSTDTSTIFQPSVSTGETTSSLLSSPAEVSSPGPATGNGSCTEKDTGCVEYQGEEDGEEEELRIKIIVGAACGAILLVVILGLFIGCVLRRRGKMSSGSKIDLSSYWDDSVTLSYINGHADIPKDSADEMISLDNDSFLNSLDSMSFTNTWTSDTSKHTNF